MEVNEFEPLRAFDLSQGMIIEPQRNVPRGNLITGIIVVVLSVIIPFILPYINPKSDLVTYPLLGAISILCVFSFGALIIESYFQMNRGVVTYRISGNSIIILHAIGSTMIPFWEIEDISVGSLVRKIKEVSTKAGIRKEVYFEDQSGHSVKAYSGLIPYGKAPFVTCSGGKCLIINLKNGSRIALTPKDSEAMAYILNEKIKKNS